MGGDVFYGTFFEDASASSGWLVADLTRVLPAYALLLLLYDIGDAKDRWVLWLCDATVYARA